MREIVRLINRMYQVPDKGCARSGPALLAALGAPLDEGPLQGKDDGDVPSV